MKLKYYIVFLLSNILIISGIAQPTINSASYNSSTGVLQISGMNFIPGGNAIDVNKVIISIGIDQYVLTTTGNSTSTVADAFNATIIVGGNDRAFVNRILNNNGNFSLNFNPFLIKVQASWNSGAGLADLIGKPITVNSFQKPEITSVAYNATTGILAFAGKGFVAGESGFDIDVTKFTFQGQSGNSYAISNNTSNVDVDSVSAFHVNLSNTDKDALNLILNKNGLSAWSGESYMATFAEDWNSIAHPDLFISNLSTVTVSGVFSPEITNTTYNFLTGKLTINGTNFKSIVGSDNDIDVTKLTVSNGVSSYQLTAATPSVDITNSSRVEVIISGADKLRINSILNNNGTSSDASNNYNLAVQESWNGFGEADLSGNSIDVSGYTKPQITTVTYDASTGILQFSGNYLASVSGTENDIDASKISVIGNGGASSAYTLNSSFNEDIADETGFSIALSGSSRTQVESLLNRNGSFAWDNTPFQVNLADNWCIGAAQSINIEDIGNPVTVSGVAQPVLNSATYNSGLGQLTISGSDFQSISGSDIDVTKITISDGILSYTLTSNTPNVDITSSSSATINVSPIDKVKLNSFLNKNGTASVAGNNYRIQVQEKWNGFSEADLTGKQVSVNNYNLPDISSVSYNAASKELSIGGNGFASFIDPTTDIKPGTITLFGGNNTSYTLVGNYDIKLTSPTTIVLLLSGSDVTNTNDIFNRNGTSSFQNTSYKIEFSDDWNNPVTWGNTFESITGITVTGVISPEVISANYNFATGNLNITGKNLVSLAGNDIDVTKISISNGVHSYTLTNATPNVDISNNTSVSLTITGIDRARINYIMNKDGNKSISNGAFNLSVEDGWNGLGESVPFDMKL
ncbi:MAG: hypothetical protein HC905_19145 [Bacteroidales bacterium]|nr:hypothetical protein [Bacteroidales bacterium]